MGWYKTERESPFQLSVSQLWGSLHQIPSFNLLGVKPADPRSRAWQLAQPWVTNSWHIKILVIHNHRQHSSHSNVCHSFSSWIQVTHPCCLTLNEALDRTVNLQTSDSFPRKTEIHLASTPSQTCTYAIYTLMLYKDPFSLYISLLSCWATSPAISSCHYLPCSSSFQSLHFFLHVAYTPVRSLNYNS